MEYLESLDFLTGVNPTLKVLVYVLILVHILAVAAWCAIACPSMFKKSDSFSDRVERALAKEKNQ
jgi:hypothetical protein